MNEARRKPQGAGVRRLRDVAISAYSAAPVQNLVLGFMKASGRERRFVEQYMARSGPKALQIGAGDNRHDGWIHSNHFPIRPWGRKSFFLDATQGFPFADASMDYVYSEHMIEHIDYAGGKAMVEEAYRVLKPSGVLRISTPDLEVFTSLRHADSDAEKRELLEYCCSEWNTADEPVSWVTALNTHMRNWGHSFLYDETVLRDLFNGAGFDNIVRCRTDHSEHEFLRGLDNTGRLAPGMLDRVSLILEGTKS